MDRSRRSRQQSGNRAIDEAIAQVAGPSGLARVRPGVLFSTAGFTINAAGLPNITEVNAFTVGLGTADPGTGVALTRALTNLQAPGKVEASKAFVAHSLSVRPIFFTRVAGIDLTIHQQYLLDLVERTGITLAIVSDVQRMGNPNHWPGAGYAPMNSLGALAAGAQAAAGGGVNQVGGGRLDRSQGPVPGARDFRSAVPACHLR